jgi:hypothetical protein
VDRNLGTTDLYGSVSVQYDSELQQMFHRMKTPQVGSYYAGKEWGLCVTQLLETSREQICVLCYGREEMVTKGIIPDKAITRIRII